MRRILLVEDDAQLSTLIREHLQQRFSVTIAADGEVGLHALSEQPDLILLDMMLPKIDGFELMKRIREKGEWGQQVPIIIVSNLSPDTNEILKVSAAYTPAFYLVKADLSLDEITEKVNTALGI